MKKKGRGGDTDTLEEKVIAEVAEDSDTSDKEFLISETEFIGEDEKVNHSNNCPEEDYYVDKDKKPKWKKMPILSYYI